MDRPECPYCGGELSLSNVLQARSVWDLSCEHCEHALTFARYEWYASVIGITLGTMATLFGILVYEYSHSADMGVVTFFIVLFVLTGGHGTPSIAKSKKRESLEEAVSKTDS